MTEDSIPYPVAIRLRPKVYAQVSLALAFFILLSVLGFALDSGGLRGQLETGASWMAVGMVIVGVMATCSMIATRRNAVVWTESDVHIIYPFGLHRLLKRAHLSVREDERLTFEADLTGPDSVTFSVTNEVGEVIRASFASSVIDWRTVDEFSARMAASGGLPD